ncbi:outer membrane protein assembly factor BamB family protein [Halorussus halophilus]|uniref:outer membrane protein assembly factor BamB family protein n=1 Tax=Halorussus halophilus TaxID=2650975 RepID=UPI0013017F71|nr:PQQ-binding-like beta-propeller repeat protein [Halorussus halophilus]
MQRTTKLSVLLVTTLLLVSSASLGGAVLAGSSMAANASDDAWQSDRADSARTGATNAAGTSVEYADTAWDTEGEGEPTGVAVADGTAYVGYETEHQTAVSKGAVVAQNATTGAEAWNRTDLSVAVGTPAVSGDTVYVSTETITSPPSYDVGKAGLFALDADTGETKWRFEGTTDWETAPVLTDGAVYGISNGTLYALDTETGEKRWSVETSAGVNGYTGYGGLAVTDGTVYVTGADGTVTAYSTSDGSQQWNVSVPAASDMSGPAVSEGALYVTAQPNVVYRLSADDGGVEWRRPVRAKFEDSEPNWISEPAVTDGTVYVTSDDHYEDGDDERVGAVHALDVKTGTEDWQFRTAARLTSAPTVGEDAVYVGGDYATVGDYSASYRGEEPTKYGIHASASHTVVYSLDRADGSQRWSYATKSGRWYEDPFVTAPVNGRVYVAESDDRALSSGGKVYSLNGSETKPSDEHQVADDEPRTRDSEPTATIRTAPKNAEERELAGNSTVKLRANASDEDDEIATYEWDLDGDGTFETTGKRAEVTVPACDSVEVTLRVTSSDGDTATETITLDAGA